MKLNQLLASIAGISIIWGCAAPSIEEQPQTKTANDSIEAMQVLEPSIPNFEGKTVMNYLSAQNANVRLQQQVDLSFTTTDQPLETEVAIFVNPQKRFQEFIGIGGAITDASAETLDKLPKEKQDEFMKACYDPEHGVGYSLIRTNIHSCDFSSGSYTYVEEGDTALSTFAIEADKAHRIPMIKRAFDAAGKELLTYASPWSPPAFMKDTKRMLQGGRLMPEFYDAWALYFAKFIKAYEAEGIPMWGVTIQNEPMAKQTWESCIYTAEEERDFLKNHLGPILEQEGLGDKNIVVWDHNRDLINHRANTILNDPEAAKYAWGTGFHWYEPWAGGEPMYGNIRNVYESFPDKGLLFTEGCVDKFKPSGYQSWANGEKFGQSMIQDFNNGTAGWTFWNVLLDETGGPNHVSNFCFAPIHGDTKTGELIYTPTFYYIGHFSKFIRPGAVRVSTVCSRSHLQATTFVHPDGKMVTVIMNETDLNIKAELQVGEAGVEVEMPGHSIRTLIY